MMNFSRLKIECHVGRALLACLQFSSYQVRGKGEISSFYYLRTEIGEFHPLESDTTRPMLELLL
jgi:hypothetical protein